MSIGNRRSDRIGTSKHAILRAVKKNPSTKSISTKLIKGNGRNGYGGFNSKQNPVSETVARQISDTTTLNIQDNNNLFQLLPDTELAKQILVSSILSPKDMINVELGYKCESSHIDGELSGQMLEVIRKFFDESYNIEKYMPEMLGDILFHKGSYPLMILPDNTVDRLINSDNPVSLESISESLGNVIDPISHLPVKSIGLLGSSSDNNKGDWSLEDFGNSSTDLSYEDLSLNYGNDTKTANIFSKMLKGDITVIDNPNILSLPTIIEARRRSAVRDKVGLKVSTEANNKKRDKYTSKEVHEALFRNTNYQNVNYISLSAGRKDKNNEHPLVVKLPPEATIPVHTPSNPSDHIGYFVLLDQYGNPLNRVKESDYYRELSTNIASHELSSQLLESTRSSTMGANKRYLNEHELSEVVRVYSDVVERDLVKRLKNGVYGDNVEIAREQDVYRIMLSRALAQMGTQILYVPIELVTYMAFDYNRYGVGKSLLEDSKILASIRSMLMFSDTMAKIKNSVGKTAVEIELDPEDPDPETTVSYMVDQYIRNRQSTYPLGASNPLDIVDFLQNAGIDVQVSGNPAYPETKLNIEDYNTNRPEVDSSLKEDIDDKYFMSLGLSPDTINSTRDVEFATSIVSSNLLLAKRVIIYQDKLLASLKEFIAKFTINSGYLREELLNHVRKGKRYLSKEFKKLSEEEVVDEFLRSFKVTLPRPESAKIDNQQEAFDKYSNFLEEAIDAYINSDMLDLDGFEDHSMAVDSIRYALISHYKREWLRNNNVLPELMDIVSSDKDGNPKLDLKEIHGSHSKAIGNSINKLISKMRRDEARRKRAAEKDDEAVNKILEGNDEEEESQDESGDDNVDTTDTDDEGSDNEVDDSTNNDVEEDTDEVETDEVVDEDNSGEQEEGDTGEDEEPPKEPEL